MAVSVAEGRQKIIDAVQVVGTEKIALADSYGYVLAMDVRAREDVPSFDRSPYDGYAFRSEDAAFASTTAPAILKVVDYIAAGDVPHAPVGKGEAVRLMTGAPIPEGADCVTMYEETEFTEKEVKIFKPSKHGENIIYAGEDVKKGTLLAMAGTKIDSGLMGTLAGQNIASPLVYKKMTVGIAVTGSELVPVGEEPGPGMILDTNQYTLTGVVASWGYNIRRYGIVEDTMEAITEVMEKALAKCDVLLITGGASVGDFDLTPAVMEKIGVEVLFNGIKIKPGKACAYGVRDGKLVCGLSGHPSSSVLNLLVVGLAGIRKMSGIKDFEPKEIEAELVRDFPKAGGSERALRGKLLIEDGIAKIDVPLGQGNVMISSTIGSDCIAMVPADCKTLKAGMKLKAFMIG